MKVKTKDVVEAYNNLKELKISSVDDETMINLWKNIKAFRPIVEERNKDGEAVKTSLMDDKFNEMQQRLMHAKEREEKKNRGEYELTAEDIIDVTEINTYFAEFNRKSEKFFNELDEKENEVDVHMLSENEMLKALKSNGKDFKVMETLSWLFIG